MSESYDTIRGEVEHEIEISRSRFLTRLVRVETEESARAVIAEVRAEHPRARHHCSAFVIGPESRIRRSNDDGEPSGTAGAPMLEALVASELSDVVAVVTRYFGGVLLGAGGLTRAYRRAVVEAAQRAERVHRAQRTEVSVQCSYEVAGVIEAEARRRGYGVGATDYGEAVLQRYAVAAAEIAPLEALVAEASAGAASVQVGSAVWVDLDE